jgi:hypothetical protein
MIKTASPLIFVLAFCLLVLSCVSKTTETGQTADQKPEAQALREGNGSPRYAPVPKPEQLSDKEMETFDGDGFTLVHPKSVRIEKEPRIMDFDIYRFIYQGEVFLSAYVGNQPNARFDGPAVSAGRTDGVVNGLPYQRADIQNTDGTWCTQVLIRFMDGRAWPAFVHFWYSGLAPRSKPVAEAIIASIKAQESGAFPHPDWAQSDPAKWFRWRIVCAERRLRELQESNATDISPLYDPNGAAIPLKVRIRNQEQHIRDLKEQLRACESAAGHRVSP